MHTSSVGNRWMNGCMTRGLRRKQTYCLLCFVCGVVLCFVFQFSCFFMYSICEAARFILSVVHFSLCILLLKWEILLHQQSLHCVLLCVVVEATVSDIGMIVLPVHTLE